MNAARISRWIFLLTAFIGCVAWSEFSIRHLLRYSTTGQQRLAQYGPVPQVVPEQVRQTEQLQKVWGRQSMFAVACSFFFMLAVMMNWVLDSQKPRPQNRMRELR